MLKYIKNTLFFVFIFICGSISTYLLCFYYEPVFLNKMFFEQPIALNNVVVHRQRQLLCLRSAFYKPCVPLVYKTNTAFKIRLKNTVKTFMLNADSSQYELVQNSQQLAVRGKKIAVLYIATGRYIRFWEGFYKSAEEKLLPNHNKTYFLFTDANNLKLPSNVVQVFQPQEPWPNITLKRYHFFTSIADKLQEFDYVYFFNANILFTSVVDEEIFPTPEQEIMVAFHPGYYRVNIQKLNYERNEKSKAFIPRGEGKYYVMGAFNGGTSQGFLKMANILKEWTDTDLKNGIIPIWHDESMLNKYVFERQKMQKPFLVLLPEYLIPDQIFSAGEFLSYEKIRILDKRKYGGHQWLRSITKSPNR